MNRFAGAFGASVIILTVGCDDSLTWPLEGFSALPAFEQLDYASVTPARDYDLWELRYSFEGQGYEVLGSGGSKSKEEIDPSVLEAFEAAHPEVGFDIDCLPGFCYKYVASLEGTSVELWTTPERLSSFLALLETEADAALLAKAHGYYWIGDDVETGAIRAASAGYELVVLKLVETCDPVRVDRFRLQISATGVLSVRDSEVWQENRGACI